MLYRLSALLCAALLAPLSSANETIVLSSGSVGGGPGVPGQSIDSAGCITSSGPTMGLATSAFGPSHLSAAQGGVAPYVLEPLTGFWVPDLACDPEARWMGAHVRSNGFGHPPRSALYCFPFTISEPNMCRAVLRLCWMIDDRLGDPAGPNPGGGTSTARPWRRPSAVATLGLRTWPYSRSPRS